MSWGTLRVERGPPRVHRLWALSNELFIYGNNISVKLTEREPDSWTRSTASKPAYTPDRTSGGQREAMDDDEWDKAGEGEDEEVIDNWEGEDEDDNVDEAWDAEPEEKPEKKVEINNPKKLSAKQLAKKQEELERDGKRMLKKMTAKERHEEKLRQEAAIQKANENLIDDVFGENDFGGDEDDEAEEVDGFDRDAVKAKANEDLFGGSDDDEKEEIEEEKAEMKQFPCSTEEEVNEFAEFCAEKIKKAKATKLVIKYFKELIKKGTSELKLEDVRLIQKELTQVYNVKRVEKNQKAQKKKKPTIKMSKRGGGDLFDF